LFYCNLHEDAQLRLLEVSHARELFGLTDSSREHLRKWLPWVDKNKKVEDSRKFIEQTRKQLAQNQGIQAGIWYRGNLAGVIGQHKIDWGNKITSIGYWLGKEYEGKGLVTLACGALINYSFEELDLNRVEILCATENSKSRAIPERLGFEKEGIIREREWVNDRYVDHVVYGMLAGDWRASGK